MENKYKLYHELNDNERAAFKHLRRYRSSFLATTCGVSAATVREWMRNHYIPLKHMPALERMTDYAVRREQLYPNALRGDIDA